MSNTLHHIAWLLFVLASVACRSKLDAETKYRPAEGAGPAVDAVDPASESDEIDDPAEDLSPKEFKDGIASAKVYFQTRNAITLSFSSDALASGTHFQLVNRTTGQTLIAKTAIPENALPLTDSRGSEFSLAEPTALAVTLYPVTAAANAYRYGENSVQLEVLDDAGVVGVAAHKFTLRDFNVFGTSTTAFQTGETRVGGLEGGFGFFSMTTTGNQTLSLGWRSMINH